MRLRPWFRIRCLRDCMCLLLFLIIFSFLFNRRIYGPHFPSPDFNKFQASNALKRTILSQRGNEDGAISNTKRRLQWLLYEIENKMIRSWKESTPKISIVRGQSSIITRDLPTYRSVLESHGFIIKTSSWIGENTTDNLQPHLVICFTFSDPLNCWQKDIKPEIRVNKLPSLRSNVWQRETICYALRKSNSSCFVLPSDYHVFISFVSLSSLNWLVQFHSGESWKIYETSEILRRRNEFHSIRAIVQPFPSPPFTVLGQPVNIRLYILITSTFPLRAYLHTQGIVYHRHLAEDRTLRKLTNQVWNLDQLWHHVRIKNGDGSVRLAIRRLFTVLVQILLSLEALLSNEEVTESKRCHHCFQLFGLDVIFDDSLHPYIIEINGQPDMRYTHNSMVNNIKRDVLSDVINMVFSAQSVSDQVAEALIRLDPETFGILGINCRVNHDFCLSSTDLGLLLDSQRENLSRRGFTQLYPNSNSSSDTFLMDILQRMKDVTVTKNQKYSEKSNNIVEQSTVDAEDYRMSRCSEDPASKPYISYIQTLPYLHFHPQFSPFFTDYTANVTYEQLIIRISASCQFCQCEVRLDEKDGPTSATNYTLGVGQNKIYLLVIDRSHSKPWLVNTYSLTIYRLPLVHGESPFDPTGDHEVCSLIQECEMRISPEEKCGIQKDKSEFKDWVTYMASVASLKICNEGNAPGRWVLPCKSCSLRKTCYWRETVWQPYTCRHALFSRTSLSKCLDGKKLLFVGDSTNRGIMHYLMERVNGSLMEWDKTHDIRIVSNLNGGKTSVAFAYYPQFWLPSDQRPVFDKTLYQLIQRSRPLDNTSNTILIVGGVQWIATQHLLMLLRVLKVEKLNGIQLVLKTLGSGFHQAVDGIHSLSIDEHQKLLQHNLGMANFAKHYGFEVIDTFNITIARYKDFLQGKCACHFHKVIKVPYSESRWRKQRTKSRQISRYHVEGSINAIYSEILLSRICKDYVTDVS